MDGGAGQRLRVHGQRLVGHSERREREIDEGRECSGASIWEEEMCSRDGALVVAVWVLEVGDAMRCWAVVTEWV